jgi:hypothetical protein
MGRWCFVTAVIFRVMRPRFTSYAITVIELRSSWRFADLWAAQMAGRGRPTLHQLNKT